MKGAWNPRTNITVHPRDASSTVKPTHISLLLLHSFGVTTLQKVPFNTSDKVPFNTSDKGEGEEKQGGETKNDRTRLQVTEKV